MTPAWAGLRRGVFVWLSIVGLVSAAVGLAAILIHASDVYGIAAATGAAVVLIATCFAVLAGVDEYCTERRRQGRR